MHIFKGLFITLNIILFFIPASVKAETWQEIDQYINIETSTILSKGDFRIYWIKYIDDRSGNFVISNETIECSSGKLYTSIDLLYNSTGRVLKEKTYQPWEKISYTIPNTRRSIIRELICQ